jgi:Fe-S-cluster containining protein
MEQKYFQCRPGELCEKAECCRSLETAAALNLGDYYRLSRATGESMVSIWRAKGDVAFDTDAVRLTAKIRLSLLHDPCPYLNEESRCRVYAARPLPCATFPASIYLFRSEIYEDAEKDYVCLRGVVPSSEGIELALGLEEIAREENEIEDRYFWRGKFRNINVQSIFDNFDNVTQSALESAIRRDPEDTNRRASRIGLAITHNYHFVPQTCSNEESAFLCSILRPIIYAKYEDEIAKCFAEVDKKVLKMLDETTRRIRALMKGYPACCTARS